MAFSFNFILDSIDRVGSIVPINCVDLGSIIEIRHALILYCFLFVFKICVQVIHMKPGAFLTVSN